MKTSEESQEEKAYQWRMYAHRVTDLPTAAKLYNMAKWNFGRAYVLAIASMLVAMAALMGWTSGLLSDLASSASALIDISATEIRLASLAIGAVAILVSLYSLWYTVQSSRDLRDARRLLDILS